MMCVAMSDRTVATRDVSGPVRPIVDDVMKKFETIMMVTETG